MTTETAPIPHDAHATPDALPQRRQRLLSLSGVAFAPFFVVGRVTSVADNPDYTWTIATSLATYRAAAT